MSGKNEDAAPEAAKTPPETGSLLTTENKAEAGEADGVQGAKTPAEVLGSGDFTLPDGSSWDEGAGKGFLDIVNDSNVPRKEMAQKLISLYMEEQGKTLAGMKAAEDEYSRLKERQNAEWLEACKKDPEFGGAKYDASKAVIERGCARLATPGAVEVLNSLELGTHPEIVRMFYRAGLLLAEDGGVKGGAPVLKSDEEVFYGKDWSKKGE